MNETTEQLLARLEQATAQDRTDSQAPDSERTAPGDDETALLRHSWRGLVELLEAADAGGQKSAVKRQKSGLALRQLLGFIAAVAASLLVAVVAWTIMKRGANSIDPQQEIAAANELSGAAPAIADVAEEPPGSESSDVVEEFAWEDSFDEQLAATSQAIRSVRADWNGGDQRYSVLLDQLEQFDEEMSKGSL